MRKIIISILFLGLVYLFPIIHFFVISMGLLSIWEIWEFTEAGMVNLKFLIPAYGLFLILWEVRRIPRNLLRGFLVLHALVIFGVGIRMSYEGWEYSIFNMIVMPSLTYFTPLCLLLPHWKRYRGRATAQGVALDEDDGGL